MKNDSESRLPLDARWKLTALQVAADDKLVLAAAAKKRLDDLNTQLHETADPAVFANIEVEITRQRGALADRQREHQEAANLVAQLKGFLTSLSPQARLDFVPPVRLKKKATLDDIIADLADVRSNIVAMKKEAHKVRAAPPPRKVLIEQVRETVERLAEKGAPTIKVAGGQLEITFTDASGYGAITSSRVGAICAWLGPERMITRVTEAIDAMEETKAGLPPQERADRLASLAEEIDQLERHEESLIVAATERGQVVARRRDASPAAILGVMVRAPNAAAA